MIYEETKYVITNDREYIADLYERVFFEVETINDILNLEMWSSKIDAKKDFNNFKSKLLLDSELEYCNEFYVKEIKVSIKM